jgi:hypothetical protein
MNNIYIIVVFIALILLSCKNRTKFYYKKINYDIGEMYFNDSVNNYAPVFNDSVFIKNNYKYYKDYYEIHSLWGDKTLSANYDFQFLFGNSEKTTDLRLVVFDKKGTYLSSYTIAEQSGDGGDYYTKKSNYTGNNILLSDFEESYHTLSCPADTITYYKKGKTRITIDNQGKIHEDTIEIKRNFKVIEKNTDCNK